MTFLKQFLSLEGQRFATFPILFFLLLSANTQFLSAQNLGSLRGTVADAKSNEPLPFVTIQVNQIGKSTSDTLRNGVVTNLDGTFIFEGLLRANAWITISFVGFKTLEKSIQIDGSTDLGTILLKEDTKILEEVVVSGEKSSIDMSLEKRVFNVAQNLTSIGGTAENLLRNVPALSIEADGSASFRNTNVTIYINNKPTQLTLAQIPANQIESVELITNPSAKYDASTSGGIVNLVLKKNRQTGFSGSSITGVGNNYRFDETVEFNYHRGKLNHTALVSYNATKNPLNGYSHRTSYNEDGIPESYFSQQTLINLNNDFTNLRWATDYVWNKYNTFTIASTYVFGKYNNTSNQTYSNTNSNGDVINYGERQTKPLNHYNNSGLELDWKHNFKRKNETLTVISGYNRNWVSNRDSWRTTSLDANNVEILGFPETDRITGSTQGNQVIVQADYVHPVNDSTKWEYGIRSFTYSRNQQYLYNQNIEGGDTYTLLKDYSQDAHILESVNALYALHTRKLSHGFGIQAGLRLEQSVLDGKSFFEPQSSFGYHYPSVSGKNWVKSFFPSFAVTKALATDSEIGLSLSRKIGRPGWRQFFVGIQSNDKQNITIGNPSLQPEFVNTAELNYSKAFNNVNWLTSVYFILEDNTIKPLVYPSASDPSVYVTTYTNIWADIRTGFDNTITFDVGEKLNVLANFNAYNVSLRTDTSRNTLWSYSAKLNLSMRITKQLTAQLNGSDRGKFPQLQGYRGQIRAVDFAIRQSFMDRRASVSFMVNDIFNSRKQIYIYDQHEAYQRSMNRRDVRYFKVVLHLPIGNDEGIRKKSPRINGPDVDFSNG
jgi:outer membrane receptor protein involved in Fe transport